MSIQRWTPADQLELVALVDRGMKYREIGAAMGRTPAAIKARMKYCRLRSRSHEPQFTKKRPRREDAAAVRRRWADLIPQLRASLRDELTGAADGQ